MIDKLRIFINKIPEGSFGRNVLTLMTGTTLAQVLTVLIAPILTRLYTPEDFGVFTLYTSILGILSVVACWRYELAIVLPEKDKDAANLLVLSILICFGMAVLTLLLITLFQTSQIKLLGAPELTQWLWFMPLSLIAVGLFQAFNYWSTRCNQFKRLAIRQITRSTAMFITQIGIGATYPATSSGGLIVGDIVGQLVATSRLAWQIGNEEGKKIIGWLKWSSLKKMFLRYKDFPLYSSWASVLNTLSTMLPALLLGYFFTPTVVGFFALGHRVLTMPMGVIGNSLAQVFFPEATASNRQGNLGATTLGMFKKLVSLGVVPIVLLTIVAPDLFALVFGSRWMVAGEYVRWLSLWIFFQFVSSPISTVYMVLEKQKDFLIFNIFLLVTRLLALVMGGFYQNARLSIILFGISGFIMYAFFAANILHMTGIKLSKVWAVIGHELLRSIPYALLPIFVLALFNSSLVFVLSALIAGIVFVIRCASVRRITT